MSSDAMHTFVPHLRRWCAAINPKRILEYGPGLSTQIMREECPEAYIVSVEHQQGYAQAAINAGHANKVIVRQVNRNSTYSAVAYEEAQGGEFDLVFVDGRRRIECALAGLSVLSFAGVLIVHDSERWQYKTALAPISNLVEEFDNTAILRPGDYCDWSRCIDTARRLKNGR